MFSGSLLPAGFTLTGVVLVGLFATLDSEGAAQMFLDRDDRDEARQKANEVRHPGNEARLSGDDVRQSGDEARPSSEAARLSVHATKLSARTLSADVTHAHARADSLPLTGTDGLSQAGDEPLLNPDPERQQLEGSLE